MFSNDSVVRKKKTFECTRLVQIWATAAEVTHQERDRLSRTQVNARPHTRAHSLTVIVTSILVAVVVAVVMFVCKPLPRPCRPACTATCTGTCNCKCTWASHLTFCLFLARWAMLVTQLELCARTLGRASPLVGAARGTEARGCIPACIPAGSPRGAGQHLCKGAPEPACTGPGTCAGTGARHVH